MMEPVNYEKMNIQWFPGHMTKAQRMIEENLKLVDAVCELLDARIPNASRNPDIDRLAAGKPRLVILNRVDLADPQITERWRKFFEAQGLAVLETDARSGKGVNSFVPAIVPSTPEDPTVAPAEDPTEAPAEDPTEAPAQDPTDPASETCSIRIDVPLKMAVAFADGSVYYGGEMKEVVFGQEYAFQMCSVNWDNGVFDGNGNGIRGSVVYRMIVVHEKEFDERALAAMQDPDRYTVKGIDIIDNEAKLIIVNGDAKDTHLETDVNNFFVAYRFHFANGDYNKKTGIENVINTPLESLSVNLPLGSTITCNAYDGDEKIASDNVFITHNAGKGIYYNVELTSVNDYTWTL